MGIKITQSLNQVLGPLAIFGIIFWVALTGVRIYGAFHPISATRDTINFVILLVSSFGALIYAAVILAMRWKQPWSERIISIVMLLVFASFFICLICIGQL
jgi:hypothetical protein